MLLELLALVVVLLVLRSVLRIGDLGVGHRLLFQLKHFLGSAFIAVRDRILINLLLARGGSRAQLHELLHVFKLEGDSHLDKLAIKTWSLEQDLLLTDWKQDLLSVQRQLRHQFGVCVSYQRLCICDQLVHLLAKVGGKG